MEKSYSKTKDELLIEDGRFIKKSLNKVLILAVVISFSLAMSFIGLYVTKIPHKQGTRVCLIVKIVAL